MGKRAQARRRRKSAKRARRALANAAKAVAALMTAFVAGAMGAATSNQIRTTARELARPMRERLSRAWHNMEDQVNGAAGSSER